MYTTLGVPRNATAPQITKAYRSLALLHHPDKNPGSERVSANLRLLNEAYETLSNAPKRYEYDMWLQQKRKQDEEEAERHASPHWYQSAGTCWRHESLHVQIPVELHQQIVELLKKLASQREELDQTMAQLHEHRNQCQSQEAELRRQQEQQELQQQQHDQELQGVLSQLQGAQSQLQGAQPQLQAAKAEHLLQRQAQQAQHEEQLKQHQQQFAEHRVAHEAQLKQLQEELEQHRTQQRNQQLQQVSFFQPLEQMAEMQRAHQQELTEQQQAFEQELKRQRTSAKNIYDAQLLELQTGYKQRFQTALANMEPLQSNADLLRMQLKDEQIARLLNMVAKQRQELLALLGLNPPPAAATRPPAPPRG